jgi:hypothetical protein
VIDDNQNETIKTMNSKELEDVISQYKGKFLQELPLKPCIHKIYMKSIL